MKPEVEVYVELIRSWPGNLLAPGELERLQDHVDDALAALDLIAHRQPLSLIDVGSGSGIPAIPLLLGAPTTTGCLVEARSRKASFLRACVEQLGLGERVEVAAERAEALAAGPHRETFELATCRALAPLPVSLELLAPFVSPGGVVLAWATNAQADALTPTAAFAELGVGEPVIHPAPTRLRSDGVLVEWPKLRATSGRFPRRTGVAAKRPLA